MTSYGQAAVFTAHVYKSSILFSMAAWVCWAHGSWGLSESPKRSRGLALPVFFFALEALRVKCAREAKEQMSKGEPQKCLHSKGVFAHKKGAHKDNTKTTTHPIDTSCVGDASEVP